MSPTRAHSELSSARMWRYPDTGGTTEKISTAEEPERFHFFFANVWLENWIPRNYTIHSNGSDPVCARPIISPDRFHMTCSCLDCRSRSKNVCSRILLFQGYISVMGIRGMQPALLGFGLPRVGHVWHCILPWTLCSAVIVCWWLWLYSPCIRLYLIAHARSFPPAQLPS